MTRLYDRIMEDRHRVFQPPANAALPIMESAQVVDITNVAEYFFRSKEAYAGWSLTDFPNIALPFPECWMEFTGQSYAGVLAGLPQATRDQVHVFGHTGILLFSEEVDKDYHAGWFDDLRSTGLEEASIERLGWITSATVFRGTEDHLVAIPTLIVTWPTYKEGAPCLFGKRGYGGWRAAQLMESPEFGWPARYSDIEIRGAIYPVLLALSFMHCKNVQMLTNDPPLKLNKARQKRGKKPLARYYTLEIDAMKEVLRREGQSEKTGLQRALHICRGHFATYTEDRPLFGRVSGTFWKPMHTRGHLKEGVVIKDYAVNAPS